MCNIIDIYNKFEANEATVTFGDQHEDDPILSNETHIIEDDEKYTASQ